VPSLDVPALVYEKVVLLAKAWRLTPGEAVGRLLAEFESAGDGAGSPSTPGRQIPVSANYHGTRVDGIYDRADRSLTITSGPGAGTRFGSPSAAAVAVVAAVNPGVNPNRNGWGFWVVGATGKRLQSVRFEA